MTTTPTTTPARDRHDNDATIVAELLPGLADDLYAIGLAADALDSSPPPVLRSSSTEQRIRDMAMHRAALVDALEQLHRDAQSLTVRPLRW